MADPVGRIRCRERVPVRIVNALEVHSTGRARGGDGSCIATTVGVDERVALDLAVLIRVDRNAPAGRTAACARDKVVERVAVVLERVIDLCERLAVCLRVRVVGPGKTAIRRVERGGVTAHRTGRRITGEALQAACCPRRRRYRERDNEGQRDSDAESCDSGHGSPLDARFGCYAHPVRPSATQYGSGRTKVHSNEACEHTFLTAQPHAHVRFRRAIERRALWLAEDAARELPNLPLEDALKLVHLYPERGSPKYEKVALRWLERYRRGFAEAT